MGQLADHPAAEGQHADDEDQPLHDRDPGADLGQVVLEGDHDKGADDGPEDRAEASQKGHEHHLARHGPVDVGQRRELEDDGLGAAGESRQRAGQHEGQKLVALGGVAQGHGPRLILPDCLEHLPERRVDDAVDDEEPRQEDRQHDKVHRERLAQVEDTQEHAAGHRLDAILAVRERRLEVKEVDHLRERERDVGEVDALAPDRERSDHHAESSRHRGARQDGELGRPSQDLGRVRRDVARGPEEDRVAEGQEPNVADQETEGAREEAEAEGLHEKERVNEERGHHQEKDHDAEGHDLVTAGGCGRLEDGRGRDLGSRGHATCPARKAPWA